MMSGKNQRLQGLKIARVSTVAFFVETQLHAQISAIVEAGADVTIIASEKKLSRPVTGAQYIAIDIPRKITPFKDFVALIRLWYLFRRASFDVVHSTTPKAGLLCAIAGRLAGVPVRIH